MKLRTKWINGELVKQILRRTGWVGVVHFLILFLAMPVGLYIQASMFGVDEFSNIKAGPSYEDILHLGMEYQGFIYLICPILLTLYLFNYLTDKYSTDFIHSAPISRKSLLAHYLGCGTILLVGSILLVGLTTYVSQHLAGLPELFNGNDYLYWFARTIMFTLVLFYIGAFVGMITGNPLSHGFVTYFILLIPYAIFYLTFNLLRHLLYGLSSKYLLETSTEHLSPITSFFVTDILTVEWIVYSALIVILPISTYYLYKIRPSEASGKAFIFRILPPVFKYSLTFVGMVLGGTFYEGFARGTEWMYFGLFIGTFFGYWIAEILIQKTWRIKQWKGFAIFIVIMVAIGGFIKLDLFGFVEKVPQHDKVQSVAMTDGTNFLGNLPNSSNGITTFKSEESIKEIIDLHKQILKEKPDLAVSFSTNNLKIAYNLKDGSKLVREYSIGSNTELFQKSREILLSKEADLSYVNYLESTVSKMKNVSLNGVFHAEQPQVMLGDSEAIKGLLYCIKKDIEQEKGNINEKPSYNLITLTIEYSPYMPTIQFNLPSRYDNTMAWLKDKNYLDRLVLNSQQVSKMTIVQADENNSEQSKLNMLETNSPVPGAYRSIKSEVQGGKSISEIFDTPKDKIIVTDKEQIEKYLRSPEFATEKHIYYVKIDLSDNTYQIWTVNNTRRIGFQIDYMAPYSFKE
ncbi:MAG: hypothetical protein K0R71_1961 [Bacillales bacterium]|nr:hypothetical protein [Bacillales bacterium]